MRFALTVLATLVVTTLACSPGGGGGPAAGGQTGDPGVADFESIDPGTPKAPGGSLGGASCTGAVQVRNQHSYDYERFQAKKLDDAHALLFDEARGLAVVDTEQGTPRVAARVPLPRSAGQLHLRGRHAFVVRRNVRDWATFAVAGYPQIGDEGELLVVDLEDLAAPKIVSRIVLEHAARTSMLTESGGTTRIHVLSDGGASGGCRGKEKAVHITSFAWNGLALEQDALFTVTEDFGDGITVAALKNRFVMVKHASSAASRLSILYLDAPGGTWRESRALESNALLAFDEDETGTLRTVGDSLEFYDLADPRSPELKSSCALGRAFSSGDIVFGPRHVFARSGSINGINTVTSAALNADGSCDIRSHRGAGYRDIQPLGRLAPTRALDIEGNQRGELKVRLLDESDLSVIDEVTIRGVEGTFDAARVIPSAQGIALWLRVYEQGPAERLPQSMQLLELSNDTLHVRGRLAPAARLFPLEMARTLVWSQVGLNGERSLVGADLSDPDQPGSSAALDLAPRFTQVIAMETRWVRLRAPDEEYLQELTSEQLLAARSKGSLELVPIDQDPDLADETVRLDANPFGRLVRVGSLLVSISRGYKRDRQGLVPQHEPAPALFEVFDLSDSDDPRRAGELRVDALALAEPCAYCTGSALDARDMVVPHALVLRAYAEDGKLTLRVLDLSDPGHPTLSKPMTDAKDELISAFSEDASVFYSFRARASGGSTPDLANFYFRAIDLTDVKKPQLGRRINVPGQLVAIRDASLYTREFTRDGGTLSTRVHRLRLENGRARIESTHEAGERAALRIELSESGHLLLDLQEPLQSFLYGTWTRTTPTELRVLDAQSLEVVGEGHVGPGAVRLEAQGTRALYGAAQGVVLMDLDDPTAPRAQAYIPIWGGGTGAGILARDSLVIEDSGALKRYGFDVSNLP